MAELLAAFAKDAEAVSPLQGYPAVRSQHVTSDAGSEAARVRV